MQQSLHELNRLGLKRIGATIENVPTGLKLDAAVRLSPTLTDAIRTATAVRLSPTLTDAIRTATAVKLSPTLTDAIRTAAGARLSPGLTDAIRTAAPLGLTTNVLASLRQIAEASSDTSVAQSVTKLGEVLARPSVLEAVGRLTQGGDSERGGRMAEDYLEPFVADGAETLEEELDDLLAGVGGHELNSDEKLVASALLWFVLLAAARGFTMDEAEEALGDIAVRTLEFVLDVIQKAGLFARSDYGAGLLAILTVVGFALAVWKPQSDK